MGGGEPQGTKCPAPSRDRPRKRRCPTTFRLRASWTRPARHGSAARAENKVMGFWRGGRGSAGSWGVGQWSQPARPLWQSHTHRGLKRLTFIAHSSGGQGAPRSRHRHVWCLARAHVQACRQPPHFAVPSHGGQRPSLLSHPRRALIPFPRAPPSGLPKLSTS